MFCAKCGSKMDDNSKFCAVCGAQNKVQGLRSLSSAEKTKVYEAPGEVKAPVEPSVPETPAAPKTDYSDSSSWRNAEASAGHAEPSAAYEPQPTKAPKAPKAPKQKKVYQKTSVGVRVLSVIMCCLMVLFGLLAVVSASLRIGLQEKNIRSAFRDGSIADLVIHTFKGDRRFADAIAEGAVDAETGQHVEIDASKLSAFLGKSSVNNFAEDMAAEYFGYFLKGTIPKKLNSAAVGDFLSNLSYDFKHELGYYLSNEYIENVKNRIDDGDLSYLSIDSRGGGLKKRLGFYLNLISMAISVWTIAICAAISLLFAVVIFFVNSPPERLTTTSSATTPAAAVRSTARGRPSAGRRRPAARRSAPTRATPRASSTSTAT